MTAKDGRPKIDDAPGLIWRKHAYGWEARWQARTNLVTEGYWPKSLLLWRGEQPSEVDIGMIQQKCQNHQASMLMFSSGLRIPVESPYDGTLRGLISAYQTDKDSTYHKLRYHVRKNQDSLLKRVMDKHGTQPLADIKARTIIGWHKDWSGNGAKVAMGHSFVTMLRTMFSFGLTILEDQECERLAVVMSKMRFQSSKPRTERMTAEQATNIRASAHLHKWPSIALAQAFQFEVMLRQKDVIGEWVKFTEPGTSEVIHRQTKWLHGLRWSEVDENLILRHMTSKRGKALEVNLNLAPMVMEELALIACVSIKDLTRDKLPASGPMLICEYDQRPWGQNEFRRKWRIVADAAGVPKAVKNMDSRAGGITEATEAGADIEHVKHAATHSNIAMTQRYSRVTVTKIEGVQNQRVAHRNKGRTETP